MAALAVRKWEQPRLRRTIKGAMIVTAGTIVR